MRLRQVARRTGIAVVAGLALGMAGCTAGTDPPRDAPQVDAVQSPTESAAAAPTSEPVEATEDTAPPTAVLVVGEEPPLSAEEEIIEAVEGLGFDVTVVLDEDVDEARDAGASVIVVSKTVSSHAIADVLLTTDSGVVFWEDNAQAIEQGGSGGLATIDVEDPDATDWHRGGEHVHLNPDAPEELRAGLTGRIRFYEEHDEITYAPLDGDTSTVAPSAVWVAEMEEEGDGRYVYYVIEADAGLADGTDSHGRRVYFGLYDETFPLLTTDGRALFDAAVRWAARAG